MSYPTIRLNVEGMRFGIVEALEKHNADIEKQVSDALAAMNIEDIVADSIRQCVGRLVNDAVQSAIAKMVQESLKSPEVWEYLNQAVYRHIQSLVKEKPIGGAW